MKKNDSAANARLRYRVRELRAQDIGKGFLETLENLTDTGGLTPKDARGIFMAIRRNPLHRIFVAVASDGQVVGATTLFVEPKFIHGGGLVGHIEDVAVREGHEGKGGGISLVRDAVEKASGLCCYKCILDCKPDVVGFYQGLGFRSNNVGMRIELKSEPQRTR